MTISTPLPHSRRVTKSPFASTRTAYLRLDSLFLCLFLIVGLYFSPITRAETYDSLPTLTGWLHDTQSKITIDQLLQAQSMEPVKTQTASFGRREGTLWLRATVTPLANGPTTLEISYPHLRNIDLYWVKNGQLIGHRQGGYHAASPKDLPCRGFCFVLPQN